jgi:hypothetical protein
MATEVQTRYFWEVMQKLSSQENKNIEIVTNPVYMNRGQPSLPEGDGIIHALVDLNLNRSSYGKHRLIVTPFEDKFKVAAVWWEPARGTDYLMRFTIGSYRYVPFFDNSRNWKGTVLNKTTVVVEPQDLDFVLFQAYAHSLDNNVQERMRF